MSPAMRFIRHRLSFGIWLVSLVPITVMVGKTGAPYSVLLWLLAIHLFGCWHLAGAIVQLAAHSRDRSK